MEEVCVMEMDEATELICSCRKSTNSLEVNSIKRLIRNAFGRKRGNRKRGRKKRICLKLR